MEVGAPCLGRGDLQCEFQSQDDARVHHLTWEGDGEAASTSSAPAHLIKTLCRSSDTRDDIPSLSVHSTPTHEQPDFHLFLPHSLCTQVQVAPDVTFKCYKLLPAPPPPLGHNHGLSASPPKKASVFSLVRLPRACFHS